MEEGKNRKMLVFALGAATEAEEGGSKNGEEEFEEQRRKAAGVEPGLAHTQEKQRRLGHSRGQCCTSQTENRGSSSSARHRAARCKCCLFVSGESLSAQIQSASS